MKNHFGLGKGAIIGIVASIIITILFAVGGYFLYKSVGKPPEEESKSKLT